MAPPALRSASGQRRILLALWFTFFVIHIAIALYLYLSDFIETDDLTPALRSLNAVYAPYLGAITLFYWGSRRRNIAEGDLSSAPFYVALLCSFIWNAVVLVFLLPLVFLSGTLETSLQNIRDTGSLLSWLASGAIGYYFAGSAGRH
jgi:hypothetical protein